MTKISLALETKTKEVVGVFSQVEFNTSSEIEVSSKPGYFSNLEIFLNQLATNSSLLNFDAGDEISSLQNDTMHALFVYLLSYTATLPRQDPFAIMTKCFLDPVCPYSMIRRS